VPKIKKLDKKLANQISAWEVVERPVSVIKELVENSIDAGSTNIIVEIKNGWCEEMIVNDNWEWIDKDDLLLTTQKYSTSKISTLQDLQNVMSFWFRWEALASISSVSDMEIISKTKKSNFWYSVKIIWWEYENINDHPSEIGTKIIVKNLFYNTPARLNYLKKPRTEYSQIVDFLNNISLSYPNIWFELISDWKNIFKLNPNDDIKTRIYKIYWDDFSSNLLEISFEMWGIKINGYISDPKISFANKNRQLILVNHRIIKNPIIYKAISNAYNRFIPHTNFPGYVLNINIDPTIIDVNVHPRKMEIRFANEQELFKIIYSTISKKLENSSLESTTNITTENISHFSSKDNSLSNNIPTQNFRSWTNSSPSQTNKTFPSFWKQSNIDGAIKFSQEFLKTNSKNIDYQEISESNFENEIQSNDLHNTNLWKIIWQIFNSYILIETKNNWLLIFDQHALAERIIYEKLSSNQQKISSQKLIFAENINLTPQEFTILDENKKIFEDIWFDIELMWSKSVMVNAIPDFMKNENINNILCWILEDISYNKTSKPKTTQEIKNKVIASTACRAAIKFGKKLNIFEVRFRNFLIINIFRISF